MAGRRAFGEDVRRQREDAGVSQRGLARAAGISQSHAAAIEAGTVKASLETYGAISAALGGFVSLRLVPGTGPPIAIGFRQ